MNYLKFLLISVLIINAQIALFVQTVGASILQDIASQCINTDQSLISSLISLVPNGEFLEDHTPTPELVKANGYPIEVHSVVTKDGYNLTMHRIPGAKNSRAVLINSGFLSGGSPDWTMFGKNKSLAYILADNGSEVWLGNFRGNTYSRQHTSLSTSDRKFWDFSWHEMGVYDIPAMIDHILATTGINQVIYIGHSMGCTAFFVTCSERPEYNDKVSLMVGMAPVAFLGNTNSPIQFFVPIAPSFNEMAQIFLHGEILSRGYMVALIKILCIPFKYPFNICLHIMFFIYGYDLDQFPQEMIPTILNYNPGGGSTKTLLHYAQLIESNKFQQFDYGQKNLEMYNSTDPPPYNLSKVTTRCHLFAGPNDILETPKDVHRLASQLPNSAIHFVQYDMFTHLDFTLANNAPNVVYRQILNVMSQFNNTN